jgi:hypothetical protein
LKDPYPPPFFSAASSRKEEATSINPSSSTATRGTSALKEEKQVSFGKIERFSSSPTSQI